MRVWLIAIAVVFSGCASSDGPKSTEDAASIDESVLPWHNITLAAGAPLVEEAFTGSFTFANYPSLGGAVGPATQNHDITGLLSAGHNFVRASIEPADGSLAVTLTPSDFSQVWTSDCGGCVFGASEIEASVVPGDLAVTVFYLGTSAANAASHADGIDYTVTVQVENDPMKIPSGIPIEVELAEVGDTVVLTGQDGSVPEVLLYGPDDVFVGILAGGPTVDITLQDEATPGKYVLLPRGHGAFYSLQLQSAEVPDVALTTQVISIGSLRDVGEPGAATSTTWTAASGQAPIQAGMCAFSAAPGYASNLSLLIHNPEGEDITKASIAGPSLIGYGTCAFTEMGQDGLTPGEYSFSYSDDGSHGAQAQEFLVHYGR